MEKHKWFYLKTQIYYWPIMFSTGIHVMIKFANHSWIGLKKKMTWLKYSTIILLLWQIVPFKYTSIDASTSSPQSFFKLYTTCLFLFGEIYLLSSYKICEKTNKKWIAKFLMRVSRCLLLIIVVKFLSKKKKSIVVKFCSLISIFIWKMFVKQHRFKKNVNHKV